MSKHLKLCPLCGSAPSMATDGITAIHCGCGLTLQLGTRSIAAHEEAWNRRALAQVEAETLEKIRTKIRALKAGPDDGDAEFISAYNCALTDAEVEVNEFSGSLSDCYKANNLPTPTKSVVPEGWVMVPRDVIERAYLLSEVYQGANEKLTPAKLADANDGAEGE